MPSKRVNDAILGARTLGNRVVREVQCKTPEQAIAVAQLSATLAMMEALIECERHLDSLTMGRSA